MNTIDFILNFLIIFVALIQSFVIYLKIKENEKLKDKIQDLKFKLIASRGKCESLSELMEDTEYE